VRWSARGYTRGFKRGRATHGRPVVAAVAEGGVVVDKAAHNQEQAALRDEMVSGCTECTMPMEADRAATLADAALVGRTDGRVGAAHPGDEDGEREGSSLRVLVVGAETGKLAAALVAAGASHILVIDHSQAMLDRAAEALDPLGTVGNQRGVRFLRTDVTAIPPYQGPFDAVIFNATLAAQADPADALRRATLLTRPGARVVVSERAPEPSGETAASPAAAVAALLVLDAGMAALSADLPLEAARVAGKGKVMDAGARVRAAADSTPDSDTASSAMVDDPCGDALWVYEVPPLYSLRDAVLLAAQVVTGFGRGSKQMGVPTANLDPAMLEAALAPLHRGVYFGFARLPEDPKHAAWCKCVVNVGQRPTFADGDGVTVEVHALRDFGRDFYGENMEVVMIGYVRPEMRFDGLPALVARIMTDIGLARGALDAEEARGRVDASPGFQADR